MESVGHFEYTLLFALVALGDEADGHAIRREIRRRTGRDVTAGAVYSVLARLEDKGFVQSWLGDESTPRGGRRPRIYRMEPLGATALQAAHQELAHMSDGLLDNLDGIAARGESR